MTRGILLFMAALAAPIYSFCAAPLGAEKPFQNCTDPFSLTVTSYSWTRTPSAQCAGRVGAFVNALSGNTGTARCISTMSATTPSLSTATYSVWENTPASNAMFIGADDKTYIWCLTTHTASETLSGVEAKQ